MPNIYIYIIMYIYNYIYILVQHTQYSLSQHRGAYPSKNFWYWQLSSRSDDQNMSSNCPIQRDFSHPPQAKPFSYQSEHRGDTLDTPWMRLSTHAFQVYDCMPKPHFLHDTYIYTLYERQVFEGPPSVRQHPNGQHAIATFLCNGYLAGMWVVFAL